jgi:hypothetical protein
MFKKLTFLGIAFVFVLLQHQLALGQDTSGTYYQVVGQWSDEPKNDTVLSPDCDSEQEARKAMADLKHRYYDANGLMFYAKNKPINMQVAAIDRATGGKVILPDREGPDSKEGRDGKGDLLERLKKAKDESDRATELLDRIRELPDKIELAKRIAEGKSFLRAKERELGDTVKEYKDMLKKSFDEIMESKKILTNGVDKLTAVQMARVNGLIDQYNAAGTSFQQVMGRDSDSQFSRLPHLEQPQEKKADDGLPRPGGYTYLAVTGADRAEWQFTVELGGSITGTVDLNGTVHNVSGQLKSESGRVYVWWKTAGTGLRDTGGVKRWHDITDNVAQWQKAD